MLPPIAWRAHAVAMLAWALLIAGWLGVGRLALAADPDPFAVSAWIALWVLGLGTASTALRRWRPSRALRRGLIALAALAVAGASGAWPPAGAASALFALTLAWALLVTLAFGRAPARAAGPTPRALPLVAAMGALIAWLVLGDVADTRMLATRMAALAVGAAVLLVMGRTRGSTAPAVGAPGCAAAFAGLGGVLAARRWPLRLSSFAMLPMMLALPWWGVLCSGDASNPNLMLALHGSSMFLPALLVGGRPGLAVHAPDVCAALLSAGALALLLAPPATASWALAVTYGAAWSVAWAASARPRGPRLAPARWRSAALSALAVCAMGAVVGVVGMRAFGHMQLALGLLAGVWLVGRLALQPFAVKPLQPPPPAAAA